MKTVNPHFISRFLDPIGGLADAEEEELIRFQGIDPNDEQCIKDVIRTLLKPHYLRFDPSSQVITKDSLQYFLSVGDSQFFRYIFESVLPPFDPPDDPRKFFIWLWEEIFGEKDYRIESTENYIVDNDIEAPNSIRLDPE